MESWCLWREPKVMSTYCIKRILININNKIQREESSKEGQKWKLICGRILLPKEKLWDKLSSLPKNGGGVNFLFIFMGLIHKIGIKKNLIQCFVAIWKKRKKEIEN